MSRKFSLAVSACALAMGLSAAQADDAQQAKITALAKRVAELERQNRTVGPLTEKEVTKTPNGNIVLLKSQVNRAVGWYDNGHNSNTTHVDNANSSTRVNLSGKAKLTKDITAGAELEIEAKSNSSGSIEVSDSDATDTALKIRKAQISLKSENFGAVHLGQGNMASDGAMEATDFTGTLVAADAASSAQSSAGDLSFWDNRAQEKSSIKIGEVFESGDASRQDRIRYDTPSFYGFSLGTSHAHRNAGDVFDVALRYSGKLEGIKLAFMVSYLVNNDRSSITSGPSGASFQASRGDYDMFNGSIGALFPFGLSLMFAYAHKDWDQNFAKDGEVYFAKLGYQHRFFEAGLTCFALDYGHYENMTHIDNRDIEGKTYAATVVQHLDRVATDIYATVRRYELDDIRGYTGRFKDATSVMAGIRIKM